MPVLNRLQSLADMLKVSHRGYFLPPRPEKQPNPLEAQVRCGAVQSETVECHHVVKRSTQKKVSNTSSYVAISYQVPDSEFVASRCAALEVWLRRMSTHPVIGHSQVLA
jgi:PX domain